jgi:hypothetical protein
MPLSVGGELALIFCILAIVFNIFAIMWYIFVTMAFNLTLLLCDNMLVSSSTLAAEIFQFAEAMARATKRSQSEVIVRRVSADGNSVQTPILLMISSAAILSISPLSGATRALRC